MGLVVVTLQRKPDSVLLCSSRRSATEIPPGELCCVHAQIPGWGIHRREGQASAVNTISVIVGHVF